MRFKFLRRRFNSLKSLTNAENSDDLIRMNRRWITAVLGIILLSAWVGCQTKPFARPVAEEHVFGVSAQVAFAEVQALLVAEGYRLRRAQPATGRIEALSAIRAEPPFRQAVQMRVRVTVTEEAPMRTRISVIGTMLEEATMPVHGEATFERPLPGIFYERFFEQLGIRLGQDGRSDG